VYETVPCFHSGDSEPEGKPLYTVFCSKDINQAQNFVSLQTFSWTTRWSKLCRQGSDFWVCSLCPAEGSSKPLPVRSCWLHSAVSGLVCFFSYFFKHVLSFDFYRELYCSSLQTGLWEAVPMPWSLFRNGIYRVAPRPGRFLLPP